MSYTYCSPDGSAAPDLNSDDLFGPERPLGTFSAKIEIAMRLRLIDDRLQRTFHQIGKLRNNVVHRLESPDLDSAPNKDHITNINEALIKSSSAQGLLSSYAAAAGRELVGLTATERLKLLGGHLVTLINVALPAFDRVSFPLDVGFFDREPPDGGKTRT